MSSTKQLAGQTVWYGLSTIIPKLLNYFLTPLITYILQSPAAMAQFGDYSVIYALIPFANVVFTYGMETAYFRFSSSGTDKDQLFQTSFSSMLASTVLLTALLLSIKGTIAAFIGITNHQEIITFSILLIAVDTLAALPFARLRQEGRPRKYAFVRIAGVFFTIVFTVLFIAIMPKYVTANPQSTISVIYSRMNYTGYLVLANLIGSSITFLLLFNEWKSFRFKIDKELWLKIIRYATPMLVVGLGGMVNETLDRVMLRKLLPLSAEAAKTQVAIYSANYKIAIFITLFIQAFRLAAEPFFFNKAADKNAPQTYARVMKFFVITLCLAFLFSALFLDIWKYMVGPTYRSGLMVVPILLAANISLGIYYNLSVWYKITNHINKGMYITIIGAAITLVINYIFIPQYGMYASAWATFICYTSMMLISYFWGQKYFPVPYPVARILLYLIIIGLLYAAQAAVWHYTTLLVPRLGAALVLMSLFLAIVFVNEKNDLKHLPVIGKLIK